MCTCMFVYMWAHTCEPAPEMRAPLGAAVEAESLSLAWCSPVKPAWLTLKPQRPVSASLALGSQVCVNMLDFCCVLEFVCFFVCLRYSLTCWLKTYCNLPALVFRILGLPVLYFLVFFCLFVCLLKFTFGKTCR